MTHMTDVASSKPSEDSNARRKILLSRLKEILLDEVDEIVVGLFSQENEFQYWQKSPNERLKAEFKTTVANMWVLLSCISLQREEKHLIAFECGKALLEVTPLDLRIITKLFKTKPNVSSLLVFLQNVKYLVKRFACDRYKAETFLLKLHATQLFENTRLDRYCENWDAVQHNKLGTFLHQRWFARGVDWMCKNEEASKKFISEQMNSRSNTLLKDQLKSRSRESFVQSNHHEDACCFEDIFYVLKCINESPVAHVADSAISKEELLHGKDSTVEKSCRKILSESQKAKAQILHCYILKNEVKEGVMGHWTVLCYERAQKDTRWRLCEYYDPSGAGFRCGDRCIKWILSHAHRHKYVDLPEEVMSKLYVQNTEREITWDMTEITKQLENFAVVEIPTYVMKDDGDMVNLLPIHGDDPEISDEENNSSDSEDWDWEYVPTVAEVLQSSFTEGEIKYFMAKHGFDNKISLAEAIEKMHL